MDPVTSATALLVDALKLLSDDERRRAIVAACVLLGIAPPPFTPAAPRTGQAR